MSGVEGGKQREPHREAEQRQVACRLGCSVTTARREVVVACVGADYVTCNMEFRENRVGEDKRRWKGVKDGSVGDDLYVSEIVFLS